MKKLLWGALAALFATAGWLAYYANTSLEVRGLPLAFDLKQGSSLRAAAKQMADAQVLRETWNFVALARVLGKAGEIKAGNYEIAERITPLQLLRKITSGDVAQSEIIFIEGWNFAQLRQGLNEHPALRHDTATLDEREILRRIGAQEDSAEGLFFPDTYFFAGGASDLAILRRAYRTMHAHLAEQWENRAPGLPLSTPYEALTLASIVEKETGKAGDRPMIAAVFANRLRRNMMLQTDPTVIYGLGEKFDGNLRRRDLLADTPYNTYTRAGLPPTPIAMPGLAALSATLHPAQSAALYFVARGDGSSQFSDSLAEHNRAVTKYQKGGGS